MELKNPRNMQDHIKEFLTLALQIPNLTNDDLLFQFLDGLQNCNKKELQRWEVTDEDQDIVEAVFYKFQKWKG